MDRGKKTLPYKCNKKREYHSNTLFVHHHISYRPEPRWRFEHRTCSSGRLVHCKTVERAERHTNPGEKVTNACYGGREYSVVLSAKVVHERLCREPRIVFAGIGGAEIGTPAEGVDQGRYFLSEFLRTS